MKNKHFRNMVIAQSTITLFFVICGFVFGGEIAGIIALLTGTMTFLASFFYTRKRYAEIEALNGYLEKVLSESDLPEIQNQEEGELSIIRNNIYKVTTKLLYQKELLAKDKVMLASSLADISHQLKTPLTSMLVMNDLLKDEADPEKRKEFLCTQTSQLNRMNWLIQTLLKLSKIDAGSIILEKENVAAKDLIKEVIRPFDIQMDIKSISFAQEIPDVEIRCDRNWTVEALQNIVKNCIEHMDGGGKLQISVIDSNIFSQIIISDTGCGIASEDIPHIFERFYRGRNAGKDSVGIGLALTKTIIEKQRGSVSVSSTEGVGSSFDIRLYKTIL